MIYLDNYNEKIKKKQIKVGKFILKLLKIINQGLRKGSFFYDEKKTERAIKFIENYCYHFKGSNGLFKLELWEKVIIECIFGLVDKRGLRQFREVFIVMARKNGKSLLATAIAEYMAFLDKEYGAEIYCLAPKLEQANIVYDGIYESIKSCKELESLCKKRRSDIYIQSTNSFIKPIAFNAKKSDGFNPHLVVNDEVHAWRGDGGLKQYEVMKSALGARKQPLILSITTAGYENDSAFDELFKRSTAFLLGDSKETRLLPFLFLIDDIEKWDDLEELKKSNPNLGISVNPDFLKEEIIIAKTSLSKKAEFLTKYCNIKQNSSQAWLEYNIVNNCTAKYTLEDFKNCYAVGGIDLSQTTDLTAATVLIEKAGIIYDFTKFFMPKERLETATAIDGVPYNIYVKQGIVELSGEHYVDYKDVFNYFKTLLKVHKIRCLKIGYDRYSAQYLVNDMKSVGFHMDDVYQGENLTPVIREFEGILKDKIFKTNNSLLKIHMLNVALKHNLETRKVRPVKLEQRSRIDGFVSVIDALTVRQKYYQEIGKKLKNERR